MMETKFNFNNVKNKTFKKPNQVKQFWKICIQLTKSTLFPKIVKSLKSTLLDLKPL